MNDEELILRKRLTEQSSRAYEKGCYIFTEFLSLAEQDILSSALTKEKYRLEGGYEGAERKLAVFGNEDICGYIEEAPIVCIEIRPLQQKFADKLTHRDFLGSLMALGIKRGVLGDILIYENTGYVFALESIAGYICDECTEVRHTSVTCTVTDSPPEQSTALPEEITVPVASSRCDAVIAEVYNLSRSESSRLFAQKLIFINSSQCMSPSKVLEEGDIVSVRGKGRFIFTGEKYETKKGKIRVGIRKYT